MLDEVQSDALSGGLYLPDLTVGRLVETTHEIITTISTYIAQDGILDLTQLDANDGHKVLVTGYDFLRNVATQIRARWKSSLGVSKRFARTCRWNAPRTTLGLAAVTWAEPAITPATQRISSNCELE